MNHPWHPLTPSRNHRIMWPWHRAVSDVVSCRHTRVCAEAQEEGDCGVHLRSHDQTSKPVLSVRLPRHSFSRPSLCLSIDNLWQAASSGTANKMAASPFLFCDVVQAGLKVTSYRRMTKFLIFCLHFPSAGTEGVNQPNDLLTVYDLHPQSVSVI